MTRIPGSVYRPAIAVLTALPREYAAVKALLDHPISHTHTDHHGTRHYLFGTMPARDNTKHALAVTMVGVGNNISAVATMQLLGDLPSVNTVILSGIAGGVPHAGKADDHVRLGDIVVSDEHGIIQFDFVKEERFDTIARHPPRPASSNLLRAARMLEAESLTGARPWDVHIASALDILGWRRPPASTDLLESSDDCAGLLAHPKDPLRIIGKPRVFLAPIASSNTLLKNSDRRDRLRDLYGVKAVEMEASGTADAAWMAQAQHFVIRGICDYCDMRKSDSWQNYAAAAAAGYLKALLAQIGDLDPPRTTAVTTPDSVRPDAARRPLHPPPSRTPDLSVDTSALHVDSCDDATLHELDDTHNQLRTLLAGAGSNATLLIPTMSWITSLDRKFHRNRLLAREAQAMAAVSASLREATRTVVGSTNSPIERLSLSLLENYQDNEILRTNWEVRCALGNLLTLTISDSRTHTSTLIRQLMHASVSTRNWDLAQMLFDALHHAHVLPRAGRDFLLSTAIEHDHPQVRWNVAAALKSITISDHDLHLIMSRLLHDPSTWVVKELIDVGIRNHRVLAELSTPAHEAAVLDRLEHDAALFEHTVLTLGPHRQTTFVPGFTSLLTAESSRRTFTHPLAETVALPSEFDSAALLAADYRRVEQVKSTLRGQHGKLYTAAERVVTDRLRSHDPEARQNAILTYLHSTHDALAWASVRALFSGRLDDCDDTFLSRALTQMLTHPSEWIRRECVEETLRSDNGRRRYLALRQIETNRHSLATVDEIRPYLDQISMRTE
ncbi:phosphorylase family protein [Nocardia nova]|uniref:phosphorylase family protein n=1 Tax=Nocardia nova TaxID=37330 RepID=UPI0018960844|nr:hypothetical protein [Nocardia nova]MBF6150341.1 hypothetical protein [Nocardia nova]